MTRRLAAALVLVLLPGLAAQAHTQLKSSVPADEAVVAPPAEVQLHFTGPMRLTALTIAREGSKDARALGPLAREPAAEFRVPTGTLASGRYSLSWRAMGADNHVMSGVVTFTVR